jgi:hypothetical protein
MNRGVVQMNALLEAIFLVLGFDASEVSLGRICD